MAEWGDSMHNLPSLLPRSSGVKEGSLLRAPVHSVMEMTLGSVAMGGLAPARPLPAHWGHPLPPPNLGSSPGLLSLPSTWTQ